MTTTEAPIEVFSRDFHIALKRTWLAYTKQEANVQPHYYLFYTLCRGKDPLKVFSPLMNPKKISENVGPWKSLIYALSTIEYSLKDGVGKFTFAGSKTTYDTKTYKWQYSESMEIALNAEQIALLLERTNTALTKTKDTSIYDNHKERLDKVKQVAREKRKVYPKPNQE